MAEQIPNKEEVIAELRKIASKGKIVIPLIVLALLFFSSFFTVDTEEVGVITRFGKYTRTVEPGLEFKIPFIEKVYLVPVERQQKVEFGFKTVKADIRSQYKRGSVEQDESNMLTGDLNLADVEWVIQYRIDDPYNYLFKVRDPESTLRDISEATMRQIVGDRTVNEVITVGRTQMGIEMKEFLQRVCREYSLGMKIEQVLLQDVNPPGPVKAAFNAVNEAEQERETLINQAKSERNKVIPKAKGQAEETIQKAEGYATERVNNALGEVARFNDLYREYAKAPDVTRQRIYLETMSEVLPKLGNKIITDDKGNSVLPLLQMQLNKSNNEK
ncbi:MAG: membrane protease subunit HflK [Flavobacteriales bacterium]|jgi:membrane protease subunit HflK